MTSALSRRRSGDIRGSADRSLEPVLSPAVVKACQLLDVLAEGSTPLGLANLSRQTGIPKSSAHSVLAALRTAGLVSRSSETGDYMLGPWALKLAQRFLEYGGLTTQFAEAGKRFADQSGETCQLGRLDGDEVVYLAKVDGRRRVQLASRVGARLPASTTALGKALLSMESDAQIERMYWGRDLPKLTPNSIASPSTLLAEIRRVRVEGVAYDRQEVAVGLVCVAVPLAAVGDMRLAISTSIPSNAATESRLSELAELLTALAGSILGSENRGGE